jgi:hypothetical protein
MDRLSSLPPNKPMHNLTARMVFSLTTLAFATLLHAQPLKVFILAGQSNMEGHAKVETFDYIGDDRRGHAYDDEGAKSPLTGDPSPRSTAP